LSASRRSIIPRPSSVGELGSASVTPAGRAERPAAARPPRRQQPGLGGSGLAPKKTRSTAAVEGRGRRYKRDRRTRRLSGR
jgi:hypothetical protein